MFSVTSEAAANAAYQAAPQWSVRSGQPPANDLFGALVNHNTAADSVPAPQPLPPPAQRRTDAMPPPTDNAGPANAASNQAASNDPNSSANAGPSSDVNAANANAGGPSGAGTNQPSQTPSGSAPKTDSTKSTDKPASADTSATDLTTLVQQAGLSTTTPNPVAVAIPVPLAPANIPAATTSGNSTAPLAIAAAAIAASTQAASSAQTRTGSNTTVTDAAATTATSAATAKFAFPAAAGEAVAAPAIQQAPQAGATPANAAALTGAVVATAPVAPKATPGKAPAATEGSTTTSGTSDPSATNAPAGTAQGSLLLQPSPAGKPNMNAAVEAATADAAGSSTPAITTHEHSPAASSGPALTDSADPGTQAIGAFQPQPNTPAAAATPAGALSVTAATSGPVPLSGLALEIAASAKSGKSRFEIRLDPADLGRIDVRIDIDRNGQVTSHLTVEKPETLSMLRQDAPQLQRALDDAGFKTDSGGLQFSLRDQSSSGQNNGNGNGASPNAQRLVISEEDTIAAAVAGRTYGRALGPSSGVDIRV